MKKPPYISHYLVLKDLLDGVDVRQYSDTVVYLTSRIENIKLDITKHGVEFIEDITKESRYAHYKPYIILPSEDNLGRAKELLERYKTDEVIDFLADKPNIEAVGYNEAQGGNWLPKL